MNTQILDQIAKAKQLGGLEPTTKEMTFAEYADHCGAVCAKASDAIDRGDADAAALLLDIAAKNHVEAKALFVDAGQKAGPFAVIDMGDTTGTQIATVAAIKAENVVGSDDIVEPIRVGGETAAEVAPVVEDKSVSLGAIVAAKRLAAGLPV